MTAYWNPGGATWQCSAGHTHFADEPSCKRQTDWEQQPERGPDPAETQAAEPATSGFIVTLPNFVRVRIDQDTTIGRGTDTVIGLSLLQYPDVSREHLEVQVRNDGEFLRFLPIKTPEHAPMYAYPSLVSSGMSVDGLREIVPQMARQGDPRIDEWALDAGSAESRVFCLGQNCFVKFEWGVQ